jgi:hypothetical protein
MMRKLLYSGVAVLLMTGAAMAQGGAGGGGGGTGSGGGAGGSSGNAGGGESLPKSQSTQSPPTVAPQNQSRTVTGPTNTPSGTGSSNAAGGAPPIADAPTSGTGASSR